MTTRPIDRTRSTPMVLVLGLLTWVGCHSLGPRDAADPSPPGIAAKLAALGDATVRCRGAADPADYLVIDGWVLPDFFDMDPTEGVVYLGDREVRWGLSSVRVDGVVVDGVGELERLAGEVCPAAEDPVATLRTIVDLIGSQRLYEQEYGQAYGREWNAGTVEYAAAGEPSCPSWGELARFDGEHESYHLWATAGESCEGDACSRAAAACAAPFGKHFVVEASGGTVLSDPWYWDDSTRYAGTSPYCVGHVPNSQIPIYFHAMSFVDPHPGDRFGSIARVGEPCSFYGLNKKIHRYDALLEPANCGTGADPWFCASKCKIRDAATRAERTCNTEYYQVGNP